MCVYLCVCDAVGLITWADFHFYFTHRLLHKEPFFSNIHSSHHQSYNPHPFSSLSFHTAEAFVYFTSLLIL